MVAPLVVAGAVAYAAVHVGFGLLFMSRATSPLSAPWRKEFLDEIAGEIDTVERLELEPDLAKLAKMRHDLESLRLKVEEGWQEPHLYSIASRLSTYRAWKHATTGLEGSWNLTRNTYVIACDTARETWNEAWNTL